MSTSKKKIKSLYESGAYNTYEWHDERIRNQQEIVDSAENKLKLALENQKKVEANKKELDDIIKEIQELSKHFKNK